MKPSVNTRVVLAKDVERYPHFTAYAGSVGTVVYSTDDFFSVCFDEPIEGCEEWDNEVVWVPEDDDEWADPPLLPIEPGEQFRVECPICPFSGVSNPVHGLTVEIVHGWGGGGRTGLEFLCVLVHPDLGDLTARHTMAAMEDGLPAWPAHKIRTLYTGEGYGDFAPDPDGYYIEVESSTLRPA
jgi:hypothetical protein